MSVDHLRQALESYPDYSESIFAFVFDHKADFLNASKEKLEQIGYELSQISGGSGLDIISLYLLSNANSKKLAKMLTKNIQWRLDRYKPGKDYPLYLVVLSQ